MRARHLAFLRHRHGVWIDTGPIVEDSRTKPLTRHLEQAWLDAVGCHTSDEHAVVNKSSQLNVSIVRERLRAVSAVLPMFEPVTCCHFNAEFLGFIIA